MDAPTPTRSALLDLVDERRAMREGHAFLDEKCMLLAGAMLAGLGEHRRAEAAVQAAHGAALAALAAALARHGLGALQAHPAGPSTAATAVAARRLMGVGLLDVALEPARDAGEAPVPAFDRSPESAACALAFGELARACAPLAAAQGNLERLDREYRKTSRRARALADVLMPEADRLIAELDTRLADLEQEDAIWRRGAR